MKSARAFAKPTNFGEPFVDWRLVQFWVDAWPEIARLLYGVDDIDREHYLDSIGGE